LKGLIIMAKRKGTTRRHSRKRLEQLVRQFKENGIKMMLEHPANLRESLRMLPGRWSERIDFDRMELVKTTFVRRDYRHVESDLVLMAPLLDSRGRRTRKKLMIYVLIEHQSEPDRLMPLRMLDYTVQIFNYQVRQWTRKHSSTAKIQLQPVLPVLFYTGTRRWASPGVLADLIVGGEQFSDITPVLKPLYLNLPEISTKTLEQAGGYFGHVLRLVQQRKARPRQFDRLLAGVVRHLETMPDDQRLLWLDLLSYIHAMIYHERQPAEQESLVQTVEKSVGTDQHRKEIFDMSQTIAEKLIEQGREKGREEGREEALRQSLLLLLRGRFADQAEDAAKVIEQTADIAQLQAWIERFATAKTFQELEIR
jgi:hypothetical protein